MLNQFRSFNIYMGNIVIPENELKIVSCDPGVVNFALRLENRKFAAGKLFDVEVILAENVNISDTKDKTRFELLQDFLDFHREKFLDCGLFIVERQLPKNFAATAISNHALSYFVGLRKDMKNKPVVMDITPKNKGRCLGVPKKLPTYWLKRWSVLRAYELFECRADTSGCKMLIQASKRDDLSDCCIQVESVCKILGFPVTENFNFEGKFKNIEDIKKEWGNFLNMCKKEKNNKPQKSKKK